MAQQNDTQGKVTREQQKRVINRDEATDGADVPSPAETLTEAGRRASDPGSGEPFAISSGDRAIRRGANDEREHHKR